MIPGCAAYANAGGSAGLERFSGREGCSALCETLSPCGLVVAWLLVFASHHPT